MATTNSVKGWSGVGRGDDPGRHPSLWTEAIVAPNAVEIVATHGEKNAVGYLELLEQVLELSLVLDLERVAAAELRLESCLELPGRRLNNGLGDRRFGRRRD